jgi:hypothetical protein
VAVGKSRDQQWPPDLGVDTAQDLAMPPSRDGDSGHDLAASGGDLNLTNCIARGNATMGGGSGWFPGATATQLDPAITQLGGLLLPSLDENHVALVDLPLLNVDNGPLTVETLANDGCAIAVALGGQVLAKTVGFTADSRFIVFRDDAAGQRGVSGDLKAAFADGTGVRTIASGVIDSQVAGEFVLYRLAGEMSNELFVARSAGGTPTRLGSLPAETTPSFAPLYVDPTAQRVAFFDVTGALQLAELDGSAAPYTVSPAGANTKRVAWSADGARLAYDRATATGRTITVLTIAGLGRVDIATDFAGISIAFSPDGTMIAYDTFNAGTQYTDAIVYHFADGSRTRVSNIYATQGCGPPDGARLFFSPNNTYLFADRFGCLLPDGTLCWASLAQPSFNAHSDIGSAYGFSPDGKYMAYWTNYSNSLSVLNVGGSGPEIASPPHWGPVYERIAPMHLLQLDTSAPVALRILSEDGNATIATLSLGTNPSSGLWAGRRAIYEYEALGGAGARISATLNATTDDGATVGTIATFEYAWAITNVAQARRIFILRNVNGAGNGAGGLWVITLP